MVKGFRDFIMRGNVIDLAVAVVIGAAFTGLIGVFTSSLIQPIVNKAVGGGATDGVVTVAGIAFGVGAVINAIITFLITAAVVYLFFVAPMNAYRRRFGPIEVEQADAAELVVLREIRDALLAQKGPVDNPDK